MENFDFKGFGGYLLKGTKYIAAQDKGFTVVIVHGMAEESSRYSHFAKFLSEHGVNVYTYDQRGHGQTALSVECQGYIGKDGFRCMVDDIRTLINIIKESSFDQRIILLGHSMGSFVSAKFLMEFDEMIDALILSGSSWISQFEATFQFVVASTKGIFGKAKPDPFFDKMLFDAFNKSIENPKTRFDWLSRDDSEVQKYIDNPYCGAMFPLEFYYELAKGLRSLKYKYLDKVDKSIPILIISGDNDPVGKQGKGIRKLHKEFVNRGFKNAELILYPEGRHEMLNETNKIEVYNDILEFIIKLRA